MTLTTYCIYPSTNTGNLLSTFDTYLQASASYVAPENPLDTLLPISFDDVLNGDGDPLDGLKNAASVNARLKTNRCPVLNQNNNNLPQIPGAPQLPQVPDLSFLKAFDIPAPAVAALFGAFGRGLILAAQNYAAQTIQNEFIKLSQGDACIIEIANKVQNGIASAAQVQYLLAQPVVTPVGPGLVLPI